MMIIHLYTSAMRTRADAHNHLKEQLDLPDYYGRNLDALFDLLTERGEACEILVHDAGSIREGLGEYGELLIETLQQAAESNPCLTVTLS